MNIFCNSDGVIFHVIPDRIFQGSAGVNKIYFIGQFPSSAQVLMAYHLPNGISTTPKMLTPVPQAQELQSADGGKFSVWEGRIGASPKVEDGKVVKDKEGNVVYDLDYTITENYGTARMQFSVFGACQGTSVGEMAMNLEDGVLATSAVEFKIEKGVPAVLPNTFAEAGDFSAVLGQILSALSSAQTSYNNISAENKSINAAFDGINATLDAHTAGISTNNASIEELRGKNAQLAHDLEAHKNHTNTAISVLLAKDVEIEQKINDNANDISMTNDALSTHTIHANATFGTDITAEMSQTDFNLTLRLKNANGEYIGNGVVIDLPLEELVVSGELDEDANEIVLTLKSGQEIRIKVGELVRGLVTAASKGQPYGVASLDADGKVPEQQLPEDIKKGKGKGAIQQVADGVANGFDFTGKNPNAEKLDDTLIGIQPYGGVGDYANAFGGKSSAQGKRSHAEGTTTVAKGKYSHAEGDNTVTLGDDSHAEGYKTLAAGYSSHAEGAETIASEESSHAEGYHTHAEGQISHTEGAYTNAKGMASHAEGLHTVAGYDYQHVAGEYNDNKEDNLYEIGNGSENERSNAFEVKRDGRAKVYGEPKEPEDVVRLGDVEDAFVKAVIPAENNAYYFPALSKNTDGTVTFWSIKGTPEPSGEKVVIRSKQGRAQMQDPVEPMDIANRRFVEETVANAGNGGGGEKLYEHKLRFVAAAVWYDGYEATFEINFACSIPDSFSMENIFDKVVQMNVQCELYRFRGAVSYQMYFPKEQEHGNWLTRSDFFVIDAMVPYNESDEFMSAMMFTKTLNEPEDICWIIIDIISDEVEEL